MGERKSGILLHLTSLPGTEGVGTMGKEAYRFVDFLVETKQKIWQILPLGQVGYGNSPYQCYSAFAGNILLIDLEKLVEEGLLEKHDLIRKTRFSSKVCHFETVTYWKIPILKKAFEKFRELKSGAFHHDYQKFLKEHSWWLQDFALFMSAKKHFENKIWTSWPDDLKFRKAVAIHKYKSILEDEIEFWKFLQFHFFRQWFILKEYANSKGIQIFGDLPLYVSTDSADVWTNADIFLVDENLKPTHVGGVPPDYFSITGQLWGNPVFNWYKLKERDYDWWLARLHFNLNLFNLVRIDHFRGLESYWSIPAGAATAVNGKWVPANGYELLKHLKKQIHTLPLIAEDLGVITPEVERLRDTFHLPGMKVLQFAFTSDASNKDLPHNYQPNFVVYTGTHDNNTTLGWLKSLEGKEKKEVRKYLGRGKRRALNNAIELAWSSTAKMAVIPLQDLIGLDKKGRLNTPGTANGNWGWRFQWKQLRNRQREFLKVITEMYNR
jgi:4-alpha-glucanotransferase